MRPYGWALSQADRCLIRRGHRYTWRKDQVRTQEEDSHLQANKRGLRGN